MTLDELADDLRKANDQAGRMQVLKAFMADRASQPKPTPGFAQTNSEFYEELDDSLKAKRESLTQLRHRHLEKIDRIARRPDFDRASYEAFMVANYDRLSRDQERGDDHCNFAFCEFVHRCAWCAKAGLIVNLDPAPACAYHQPIGRA